MNLNQITKELEKQAEQWESILNYKPEPKGKQNIIPHPAKHILALLDEAYHHQKFPRELDDRCDELYQEVTEAIPIWPSLEWGDTHKQPIIEHVRSYAKILCDTARPKNLMTLIVAVKNFDVSKPTLLRAIKDGRLIAYPQSEDAAANTAFLVDAVAVAALWVKRD